jgi:DNA-binding PadR family transcriptional regulator
LPNSLQELNCSYNQLTSLPDNLPNSLLKLDYSYNIQLIALYPTLNDLQSMQYKIKYIQQVNTKKGIQQCKEWLSIVNQNNIFLEIYERKIMNPNNLKIVVENENTDVNLLLDNYLAHL